MFCENCGKTIQDTAASCPYCGQSTGVGSAVGSSAAAMVARLPQFTHPKLESGIAGFCRPVLEALEDGKVLRTLMALILRVVAIATALGSLYLVIQIVKEAFQTQETQMTIGLLLLAAFVLVYGVCAFFIYFYRAASILALGESSFTVIPMVSILLRTIGELYSTLLLLLGVGGCLFVWFTGRGPQSSLGPLAPLLGGQLFSAGPFIEGLQMLLFGFSLGFACLLGFYFLAEFIVVIADIARNVRVLVQRGEQS